ncbi:hypothetical protein ACB094_02G173900 [Castanea mollissima]
MTKVQRSGIGSRHFESAKFRHPDWPRSAITATSCARAAISAVGKVPSQILDFLFGSRISQTHFCAFFLLTPRYTGCLVSLNFFLPSRLLGFWEANMTSSSNKFNIRALLLSNSQFWPSLTAWQATGVGPYGSHIHPL